jgi:hypothetical protein
MAGRRVKLGDFAAELKKETAKAIRALEGGLYLAANNIIAKSIREVPKDDGPLRSSNFVSSPKRSGDTISVRFGYGGMAARYALFVHEMPAGTNWTTAGTGPKYLERPLNAARPRLAKQVEALAERLYEQGRGFSPAPGRRGAPS